MFLFWTLSIDLGVSKPINTHVTCNTPSSETVTYKIILFPLTTLLSFGTQTIEQSIRYVAPPAVTEKSLCCTACCNREVVMLHRLLLQSSRYVAPPAVTE
jgi:hypothetical protein